jgi:hypothetical protein
MHLIRVFPKKKHKASQKAEEVISSQAFHVRKDLARYIDVCPHYHASSLVCTLFFFYTSCALSCLVAIPKQQPPWVYYACFSLNG